MKKKFFGLVVMLIIFAGAISFGVYAALFTSLQSSGTIKFNAYGVDIDVDATITGAVGTDIVTSYSGTTNKTRQPSKNLVNSVPWNFGNLAFDEINAKTLEDLLIIFEFKIANYSNFPIEARLEAPTILNLNIEKLEVEYSYGYDSSLGADIRSVMVYIKPSSLEIAIALTNLNFVLNILKTQKDEADISKFVWETPKNGTIEIKGNNLQEDDRNIVIPRKNGTNKVNIIGNNSFKQTSLECITIPNGVISIGDEVFKSCIKLNNASLPATVQSLGKWSFLDCSELLNIKIPKSVIEIKLNCFMNTPWQTKLDNKGDEVVYIDNILYKYKGKATSVEIVPGTTFIFDGAFSNCTLLKNVIIPDSIKGIGSTAFVNCISLTNINISANVTEIGLGAFLWCSSLSAINVDAANENYSSIDGVLFDKSKKTLLQYPGGGKSNYIVPDGVETIGQNAFEKCKTINTLTLSESVKTIDEVAFHSSSLSVINFSTGLEIIGDFAFTWSLLETVTIPNSVNSLGESSFSFCKNLVNVFIERDSPFEKLGNACFSNISGLTIDFGGTKSVFNQFTTGVHFDNGTELMDTGYPHSGGA